MGRSLDCDKVIVGHINLLQYIRNYIYHLCTLYTHLEVIPRRFLRLS